MKLCIVLQRRFSVFGHAIACVLQEKYGIKEFCGYTYLRSAEKFLRTQKQIVYDPLLVDEDLHCRAPKEKLDPDYLKSLEKEYGLPNLWPYIARDSYFMMDWPHRRYSFTPACSHEDMLKHLQVRFKALRQMLEEIRPDTIFFINIGAMANNILYQVAQKMGIKTWILDDARIQKRVVLTGNCYNQFPEVAKIFARLRRGEYQSCCAQEALDFLKDFRADPAPRILNPSPQLSFLGRFFSWATFFPKYLTSYVKEAQWKDYLIESPFNYFRNRLKKHFNRWRGFGGLFEKPQDNEDFAFFPLHYEPEISTLLLAPFYTNQIALIQNIARALPVHFKLYVKEHPAMLYCRGRCYYQELKKIPNVRLIEASHTAISLIQKAKLVLTITGTAGWEAVLLKKPVITFGSVFYNHLSMVRRCDNPEQLPFLVKDSLEKHSDNEEELVDFLSALFEDSFSLNYEYLWHEVSFEQILKNEDFRKFVDFLARRFSIA